MAIPDGQRTPGGDSLGYKVEIERESLLKVIEMAAKLKAVDALAQGKTVETDQSVVNVTIVHVGAAAAATAKRIQDV